MEESESAWLDQRIDTLEGALAAAEMQLDPEDAAELITDWAREIAASMEVPEAAARRCIDDEFVKAMAWNLVTHCIGIDLLVAPRTVPLTRFTAGMVVADLADAMQIRAANEPAERLREFLVIFGIQMSAIGQIIAESESDPEDDSEQIMFPPALLLRAAIYMRRAAAIAENGGKLPRSACEAQRDDLAESLRLGADELTVLIDLIDND